MYESKILLYKAKPFLCFSSFIDQKYYLRRQKYRKKIPRESIDLFQKSFF